MKIKFPKSLRETAGMSYKDYLTSIRISYACEMLKEDNLSITHISERIGFGNASYFHQNI